MTELLFSQLTDIFRIGLLIGLVYTTHRTVAVTGRVLPLILGMVFVAVILPTTLPSPTASLGKAVMTGLLANAIILVHVLALARLVARFRR